MRGRRRIAGICALVAMGFGAAAGPLATPAKADCLYLDLWLVIEDSYGEDDPMYVHQGCVTETGQRQRLFVPSQYKGHGHPHGTPNGYYLDLRAPVPG